MTTDKEREAFEAWVEADLMPSEADWFRRDKDGDYSDHHMERAWKVWQARAELAAPVAETSEALKLAHSMHLQASMSNMPELVTDLDKLIAALYASPPPAPASAIPKEWLECSIWKGTSPPAPTTEAK